ncbi:MAG TPA: glycoside hydrolase family 3 C-terminal domain-containing protein [Candidatus Merdenecus merdavium]|nr:glycoside hydrolase family 3 C-terminal domain-containing protein [Candidatus Merdenecus merdavium]
MSFIRKHMSLFRGLTSVFTFLFLVVMIVQVYATGTYQAKVDEFLGTNSGAVEHSTDLKDYKYQSDYGSPVELLAAEERLNERIEEEGAVLLKGSADDIVVEGEKAVTLFGIRSFRMQYNGNIGAVTNESLQVRLDEALEEKGISVNQNMIDLYREFLADYNTKDTKAVNEVPVSRLEEFGSIDYADYQDAAIVVLGRTCSEAATYFPGEKGIENPEEFSESLTGNILGLSDDERNLINYVKTQGFSKVIVLLNTANTMEIEELKQNDSVDAIMLIGNPSAYGNYGVADILAGNVSPSGHLADTYAVNTAVAPSAVNFGSYEYSNSSDTYSAWYQVEAEGIYTGYKYYETRYYDTVMGMGNATNAAHGETYNGGSTWNYDNEVSYSFGYGVEGSDFMEEIIDTDIDWTGKKDSTVTVKVTNVGDRAAKHVVQLYVQTPYTEYDKESGLEKSAIQLVAYGKTGEASENDFNDVVLLETGESEEVTVSFNVSDFSSYDTNYSHDGTVGAYILEEGTYYFATGNGSHDAVNAIIKEQDNTLLRGTEIGGDVFFEELNKATVFTVGEDGETLIENQLEDMNFTYEAYGDAFTSKGAQYLTRNDWEGTFPVEVTGVTANEYMLEYLGGSTYDADAVNADYDGKVYIESDFGTSGKRGEYTAIDLFGITDYEDKTFEKVLSAIPFEYYSTYITGNNSAIPEILLEHGNAADSPGGIIYGFGLYNDARKPYAVEAEEDSLRGVAPSVYVGSPVMASTFSHLLASEEGRLIGNDGLWVGAYWWFGPGMNLHRSPYNARNNEYYSEDAVLTGNMGADVTAACQKKGLVVCAKHFAFNDIEENRTGVGAFMTEQAARENELRGFEMAFTKGGMKSVMTGFNRAGVTFSSAHEGLISGICRGEWNFDGLVITDSVKDKNYMIAADCIVVGTDFMLGGAGDAKGAWENVSAENLMKDSVLTSAARESMHRYLYTFADTALIDGYGANASMNGSVWWATALTVALYILGSAVTVFLVLWILGYVTQRKEKNNG